MSKKYYTKEDIFLSRLASILKKPTGVVRKMFAEREVTTIFCNTLLQAEEKTVSQLENMGAKLEKVEWTDKTYIVKNLDKKFLSETRLFKDGFFNLVNLSHLLPTTVLDVKNNESILIVGDTVGHYTLQLSNTLGNKGDLTATLDDRSRVDKVNYILSVFGVKNCTVTYADPTNIGNRAEGHYDKILVHPINSNEGEIYLSAEKSLRFWSAKQARIYSKKQNAILLSCFKALKKGGMLIYTTTTLEPEENEGVVTELLDKYTDANVEPIELFKSKEFDKYKSGYKIGIKDWNEYVYSNHTAKTYRIMPSGKMMGMYLAKISKK